MVIKMKVLFGGSFNPPTKAHFEISKKISQKFNVSEFVFLPTADNYSKPDLAPFKDRFNMCLIGCKYLKNATVSDFEGKLNEYKGTTYTLKHFSGYWFLMGADNFDYIEKWIDFPNVIINNKFILVPREGYDFDAKFNSNEYLNKYRDNFIILDDFKEIDLSATKFRKTLDKELVIDEVYEYINNKGLYK